MTRRNHVDAFAETIDLQAIPVVELVGLEPTTSCMPCKLEALAASRESPKLVAYSERDRARLGATMRADVPSQFLQRTDGSRARRPGTCSTRTRLPSSWSRPPGQVHFVTLDKVLDGRPAPRARTLVRPWARGPSTWDDGCRCVQERPNRPNWADSKTQWTDWRLSNCCHGATAYATITFASILGRIPSRIRRYPASTLRQRAFWAPVRSGRPAVGTMAR
jgi:hypothetical protein